MRKGIQAINDGIAQASRPPGGSMGGFRYFNLKADESIVLRFLTDIDDAISVDFYEWVLDNQGKSQVFISAPDLHEGDPDWHGEDWVVKYGGMQQDYQSKEIHPAVPKRRTVALAVVREEVATEGPNGRPIVSYQDAWVDVEGKDGKTYEGRQFMIVRMAYKNFWSPIISLYDEYGTLSDRDYKIKRIGSGLDTTYSAIPKDQDPGWNHDGSSYRALHEHYGYGTGKNADGDTIGPDSEDRYAYCPQTLEEWAEVQASEDRAKYFLEGGPGSAPPKSGGHSSQRPGSMVSTADEAQASPAPSGGGTSLKDRLSRHR